MCNFRVKKGFVSKVGNPEIKKEKICILDDQIKFK